MTFDRPYIILKSKSFLDEAFGFIDKSGAKPPIFSQSQKKKAFFVTLTLILIENAGFAFGEINKLAPHLSMKGEAFRLKMNLFISAKPI